MPRKPNYEKKIVDAALKLAAERSWRGISLAEIARAADVPLAHAYETFPDREGVLAAFMKRIDMAALEDKGDEADDDESARDRVFDATMRRYEAMTPYREGVRSIYYSLSRDPVAVLQLRSALLRSLTWVLEDAGVSASGARGMIAKRGLGAIIFRTTRVWLDDDASDYAKTMADLDKRLRWVEGWLNRRRGRGDDVDEGEEAA